jgi:hypothetical protein
MQNLDMLFVVGERLEEVLLLPVELVQPAFVRVCAAEEGRRQLGALLGAPWGRGRLFTTPISIFSSIVIANAVGRFDIDGQWLFLA